MEIKKNNVFYIAKSAIKYTTMTTTKKGRIKRKGGPWRERIF